MATYKIKQSSIGLYVATALTVIYFALTILFLIKIYYHDFLDQPLIFFIIVTPFILLSFYIPKFTSTADVEITLDEDGFKKKWLQQFIMSSRPDVEFKWTEISDFICEPSGQFNKFKLRLRNGSTFKFYHNTSHDKKDEFQKFILDFEEKVSRINATVDKSKQIKPGKTIFEKPIGLVIAGFFILAIIFLTYILINKPPKHLFDYIKIGIVYLVSITMIALVYLVRKYRDKDFLCRCWSPDQQPIFKLLHSIVPFSSPDNFSILPAVF